MNDAEKRLHKLAQRDSVMFKRAETMGLQVDHAALETYIRKNFLNQAIDHQEIETEYMPTFTAPINTQISSIGSGNNRNALPPQEAAANQESPAALSSQV